MCRETYFRRSSRSWARASITPTPTFMLITAATLPLELLMPLLLPLPLLLAWPDELPPGGLCKLLRVASLGGSITKRAGWAGSSSAAATADANCRSKQKHHSSCAATPAPGTMNKCKGETLSSQITHLSTCDPKGTESGSEPHIKNIENKIGENVKVDTFGFNQCTK